AGSPSVLARAVAAGCPHPCGTAGEEQGGESGQGREAVGTRPRQISAIAAARGVRARAGVGTSRGIGRGSGIGSLVRIGRSLIRIICRRSVALVTVGRGTRLCTVGCTVCRCCGGGLRGGVRGRCGRSGGTGVGVGRGGCLCVRVIRVVGVGGGVGCLLCRGVRIRGRVRRGLRGGLFVGGGFRGCSGVPLRCCRCRVVGVLVSGCLGSGFGDGIAVVVGVRRCRGRGGRVRIGVRTGVVRGGGRSCGGATVGVSRCVGRTFRRGVRGRGGGCCRCRLGASRSRGIGVSRVRVVGPGGGVGC